MQSSATLIDPARLPEPLRSKLPLADILALLETDNILAIMPFVIEVK